MLWTHDYFLHNIYKNILNLASSNITMVPTKLEHYNIDQLLIN